MPRHFIVQEGPQLGLILNLEGKDEWIIGRDPSQANFLLEDPSVSRKHAICSRQDDGFSIKDLSTTNPILVNDQTIGEPYLLHEGDKIKIGQNIFLYSEEDLPQIEEEIFKPSLEEEKKENIEETIFKEESSNDTIFEEEKIEDTPFSFSSDADFILKVISGPNAGAEFGLNIGKNYIIGKDPNFCDIIFNDLSVSKKHTQIEIDQDNFIYLEDLGSKNGTLVNGLPIEKKEKITTKDFFSLGTTTCIVVDRKEEGKTILSPPSLFERKEKKEEKEPVLSKKKFSWQEQIIPRKHLVIAGATVLIFFVSFISFFSLFKGHKVEIVQKDATEEISSIISQYEAVEFSFNPRGESLFLTGHVLTSVDHDELLYLLHRLPYIANIDNNIIIDEYVWKNMNDVLSHTDSWRGISIHAPKAGKFLMIGYIQSPKDADLLMDYINVNFPYLDRLENRVVIEEILNVEISSILIQQDFSSIKFQVTAGELILSGQYEEKKVKAFSHLIEQLKSLEGIRSIKNLTLVSSDEIITAIDLSSKYAVSGYATIDSKNFGVVINGRILTQGDILDGMKILSFSDKTILLAKDSIKYKINFRL